MVSERGETIAVVWLFISNETGFVSNRKITVCSSLVTSIYIITSEHHTITQFDARFNRNANTENMF